MLRILEWFYATELKHRDEAAFNRGFVQASQDHLAALRRTKLFLFGEAPVSGLNDFLARSSSYDVSIIGCHFGEPLAPTAESHILGTR